MKKLILSVAVMAVTFGGFSAAAKDKKEAKQTTTETAQRPAKQMNHPSPFEGIELTDAQKEQLKQLREERPDKAERKEAKREARREARRAQLDKIKAILTPEQYVTYLENLVLNGGDGPRFDSQRAKQAQRAGKMERPAGKDMRGDRPDRQPRPQQQPE